MVKFSIIVSLIIGVTVHPLCAQKKLFTRTGKIEFHSKAPLEDIRAVNKQVNCIYDIESNRIVAKVLIKAFEFDKALMQSHFNENYLESDKFPKASFKGKIVGAEKLSFTSNWDKNILFEGDLTIHGITRKIKETAQVNMNNGILSVNSVFYVLLKNYEIKIPSTVINNIAEKVKVSVNLKMKEL